jgi:ferric-chelate reductase [NAD(P)H]
MPLTTPSNLDTSNLGALNKIQYGMYIITTKANDKINGQVATTVFQVTSKPIRIAVCLSKKTYTYELLTQSKKFGVSILEESTPFSFIGQFGFRCGRDCNKFGSINYKTGTSLGCPLVLTHTLVALEVSVENTVDIETHSLFIGRLEHIEKIKDGKAMTYEYYHDVIKGKTPENAPTYIAK